MVKKISSAWVKRLQLGSKELNLDLNRQQIDQICVYIAELVKWNKAYNLTAIRDVEQMLPLHVLDSLSIVNSLSKLPNKRIIDVGTGAGLPGLLLAIIWPNADVHLLDTNGKKTRFLAQCKHALGLTNLTVIKQRVEDYNPSDAYDIVVSRAFAAISDMLRNCHHLISNRGHFAAMKGQYPVNELTAMLQEYTLTEAIKLTVPEIDAPRHLLIIRTSMWQK